MTKRNHALVMADPIPPHCTPSYSTEKGHVHLKWSSPYGSVCVKPSSECSLRSSCPSPQEPPSKYRCTQGTRPQTPISISSSESNWSTSSESNWSTSPQQLSIRDSQQLDSMGMTLQLGDCLAQRPASSYWVEYSTQEEALVGCGSWSAATGQASEATRAMPFDVMLGFDGSLLEGRGGDPAQHHGKS